MNVFLKEQKFEDIYIKGMDVDLHLIAKGNKSGIPILFLPGITSYCYSFAEVLEKFSDDYYCLSMDIRGRGQSSWPETGYKLNNYVEDVLSVVNYLISNPIKPVILGHSMGARIATAFASQYSNLISGLVLIDPPINGPGQRNVYPNPLEEMFLKQKKAVDEGRLELFKSFFSNFSEIQVLQRAEEYRNCSVNAIIESYKSFLYEPFHVYLKNCRVPMLLLAAEKGDTIRDEELKLIKRLSDYIEVERIMGVGHMIYKEEPDTVIEKTYSFIKKYVQ